MSRSRQIAKTLSRRVILQRLAATAASLAPTLITHATNGPVESCRLKRREADIILQLFGGDNSGNTSGSRSLATVRSLGSSYLHRFPHDRDAECIHAAVVGSTKNVAALRTKLATAIRCEFRDGDTVLVDRWVLSRTEARSYALVALLLA